MVECLNDLLGFIDEHNGAVTAIATIILAVLTFTYVLLTKRMLSHMQKSQLPNLVAGFDFGGSGRELLLRITNMGSMIAKDICIEVIKESITWTGKNDGLSQLAPVRHGVSYLPPNQQLSFRIGFMDWKESGENSEIELIIRYESESGEKLHSSLYFNLDQYRGMMLNKDPESKIVRALERIEQQLKPDTMRSFIFSKRYCKFCGEEIKSNVHVCPHCQSHLNIIQKLKHLRKSN